jgi:mono/diheme cytochrome c family protein
MKRQTLRKILSSALLIAGVAFLLASCGGSTGTSSADVSQGRESYVATCALCHGAEGEGKSRLGKALQGNSFVGSLNDEELVEFLKEGRPSWDPANERGIDMPPKGGNPALTDEDLMEIVAYLRTL